MLDLSLAPYAALVGRAGVDPDAEVRRFDGSDPSVVYGAARTWSTAGRGMEEAWASSWAAQARLAAAYTTDGAPVYDRAAHEAMLPAGFRDAGAQLGLTGHRLGAVATSLDWESAMARSRLEDLHGEIAVRAREWAARVAEAGLIPVEQADAWRAERDRVEQAIVSMIADAHSSVKGNVTRYEGVISSALAGLAEQGFAESLSAAGGGPGAPVGDPVVLAGLGTPVHAGYAADPVNTGLGNFVEVETDLAFVGVLAGLSWSRTYNSRAAGGPGPHGPRWASWASTRLRADDTAAQYVGPDGREMTVPRRPDGSFARGPDLAARVLPGLVGGLVLAWNDGRRWAFGPDGRPLSSEHGPGTAVGFVHDEHGRLVELNHCAGRRVTVSWAGLSILSVSSTDGRAVVYGFDDTGHLVHAGTPAGDRRYGIGDDGLVVSVTDADGVVEVDNTYDEHGRVVTQTSAHGRVVTFAYRAENPADAALDGAAEYTVVADESGGPVNTYRHDDAGRLVEATDGHGHLLRKRYDRWGDPVEVTRRGGGEIRRTFDDRARLVRQVTPSGAVTEFGHDDADRLTRITVTVAGLPEATTRLRYDGAERVPCEVVDAEGGRTVLSVSGGLVHTLVDADGVTVRFRHDTDGHLIEVIDADGGVARIDRDAAGHPTAVTSPAGRRTELTHDPAGRLTARRDPAAAVWRHEYSPAGRPTAHVDPLGHRTELRYGDHGDPVEHIDPLGTITAAVYDVLGNLTTMATPDGAKWTWTYDALCRLTTATDPTGGTWLHDHDPDGHPTAVTDPTGRATRRSHDRDGALTGLHDGVAATGVDRDPLGRPTTIHHPDATTTCLTYDRCGRPATRTGPDGATTSYVYSPAGRLIRTVSPAGREQTREYDPCGRLAAAVDGAGNRWEQRHDPDGLLTERISPTGLVERLDHDPCGRLIRHRIPGRGTTTRTYDPAGRVVAITDRTGRRTFTHDPTGRVTAATDALGHTTHYTRDDHGRVTAVTDPLGATTRYRHDPAGRVTAVTDPLDRTTHYTHDPAGRLREITDPDGHATGWTHDPAGRIATITAHDGTIRTIGRDPTGRPVHITETGPSAAIPVSLTWDTGGRLAVRSAGDRAVGWTYDADGLRAALHHPDGTRTRYTRDPAGRVVALHHPALGAITHHRDPDGRTTAITGADTITSLGFTDGWLTTHTTTAGDRARTTHLTRDDHGRVTTTDTDGHRRAYTHDAAGQLTAVTGLDGTCQYGYDAAGRLTHDDAPAGRRTHAHDAAAQPLTTTSPDGERHYVHDGAGRRTRGGDRTYHWDAFGRLRQISDPTRTTRLHHDSLGDLAAVDHLDLTWDALHPAGQLAAAGQQNIIGLDHPYAMAAGNGTRRALHPDWQHHTGTPNPDPYGGAAPTPGLGYRSELAFHHLIWLRHRAYDPTTRTFLSTDPLPPVPGTPTAANPYHYADNNPVDNTDPWGLRPLTDQDLAAQEDGGGFDWSAFGHGALDVIGLIPVLGEPADLINAGWYAAEGDWTNAGLSAAGVIPGLGVAAVGARMLGRTADLVGGASRIEPPAMTTIYRNVDEAEFTSIAETGRFEMGAGAMEGKFFALDGKHAEQWGEFLNGGQGLTVQRTVPERALAGAEQFPGKHDGIGPAVYLDRNDLDTVNNQAGEIELWP